MSRSTGAGSAWAPKMPGLSFEELFPNVAVEEETAIAACARKRL